MMPNLEVAPAGERLKAIAVYQEGRTIWMGERPLTFEEYLDQTSEDDGLELVKGVLVERMAAQIDHEKLYLWLITVLNNYVRERGLGMVLGSRAAVEINEYNGRLPDILFVRRVNEAIVRQKAIYGPPDFITEIVSPGNRPADLIELETDYRSLGVAEIWFVNHRRRHVRTLLKRETGYEESVHVEGNVQSETVDGFEVALTHLFDEPRPSEMSTAARLLERPATLY